MKAIIVTPSQNIESIISFYKALSYQIIFLNNQYYATDGQLVIHLDTRKIARAGIIFYTTNDINTFDHFEKIQGVNTGIDPNGVYVFIKDISEYPVLTPKRSEALTGNFMGMSIETLKFKGTVKYWEQFGYKIQMGSPDKGWVQMDNGSGIGIGIMSYGSCPHSFRNPSLTFFNGKENIKYIENISASGIDIAESISHFNPEGIVDNMVLADPGGYGFFVFSD